MKINLKGNRTIHITITMMIIFTLIIGTSGCTGPLVLHATDLMKNTSTEAVVEEEVDALFVNQMTDFSVKLLQETTQKDQNSLISPLSIMLALSMTANGADGDTFKQMEQLLGGEIPLTDLNEYLYSYVKNLPSEEKSKLSISNSIWFRDDADRLTVKEEFLQINADYFGADAYKAPFDDSTLKDINSWVENKTDGLIDKILEEISDDAVMYLINAVVFDAKWEIVYLKNDIQTGDFYKVDGSTDEAEFMNSNESYYIEDDMVTGFVKPYYGGNYSFVALLPNEDVTVDEYIASLTGEGLQNTINNAQYVSTTAALPKFEYDYSVQMNDALKTLGMPLAFHADEADFDKMGESSYGNIFIGEVLHKTFISVDELGTKAGAVTKVEMTDESSGISQYNVRLDRPFIYCIIDTVTGIPIFIGTVMSISR